MTDKATPGATRATKLHPLWKGIASGVSEKVDTSIERYAQIIDHETGIDICHGTTNDILNGKPLPGDWNDGTDGACPGWWRGHDNGAIGMKKKCDKEAKKMLATLKAISDRGCMAKRTFHGRTCNEVWTLETDWCNPCLAHKTISE